MLADSPAPMEFLPSGATDDQLLAAVAANHLDWLKRLARSSGGQVTVEHGIHWTDVARERREITLAVTEPPGPQVRERLDSLLDFCRAERVDRVGCWAMTRDGMGGLGTWLGARGFRPGGRPHWMALDLEKVTDLPSLEELADATGMAMTDSFDPVPESELPCYHPDTAWVRQAMTRERPQRVWHGIQWADGEPAGQVSICLTTGPLGVCGLHDTVVVASKRVKGVGGARLDWVCRFALDLGCRYVVTNAAEGNATLFGIWGFRSLGFGQTWWLPGQSLETRPSAGSVAFAEAVGSGDLDAMSELLPGVLGSDLEKRLPNGLTPVEFAAATARPESAEWLVARGAGLDVLSAWDLGWRDRAGDLLDEHPELLSKQRPRSGKTLLHLAVERDDLELAQALLARGIDTSVKDHRFGGTALDWARTLGRPQLVAAIRRHERGTHM